MAIQVNFRDQLAATGDIVGGKVVWSGPKAGEVERLSDYYAKMYGKQGRELLAVMKERMQGNWWVADKST